MVTSVTFRGGETTGSVADRKTETAKQETTGGVGARRNQDSIFTVDNELKQDTVCFRGSNQQKEETSTTSIVLGTAASLALAVGLLGLAHKNNWFGKIENEKIKDFFKHSDKVTEPCYKACKWVKNNCYDKVANWFKSSK